MIAGLRRRRNATTQFMPFHHSAAGNACSAVSENQTVLSMSTSVRNTSMVGDNSERKAWIGVLLGASLIALVSARPYAGGWNDGSRLATVESLVDRHTLAIDDSMFVNVAS